MDTAVKHALGSPQSGVAVCPIRDLKNRIAEKDVGGTDAVSRFGYTLSGHDRYGA